MNSLKVIAVVFLSLVIASCNKDDNQASGVGDAVIVTKKSGTNDVYGLSLYAYTYSSFKSVTATSSAEPGKTYTMKANQGYKTNFLYETPDSDYTTVKPAAGTFNFSAVFDNGVTQEFQNVLTDKVLSPAIIDTCMWISSKHALKLIWKPVTNAESYAINIMDGNTLAYSSPELPPTMTAVWISSQLTGWTTGNAPVPGKTYKVIVFSYLLESVKSAYNLQCVSIAESDAVWGD
jgi:hypothetical protein